MQTVMLTRLPEMEGDGERRSAILTSMFCYAYEHSYSYWVREPNADSREVTNEGTMVVFSAPGWAEPHSMAVKETLDQVLELFTGVPTVDALLKANRRVNAPAGEPFYSGGIAVDTKGFSHYVNVGPTGSIFVKSWDLFRDQGGHKQAWGTPWWGVTAKSDDEARDIAKREHRAASRIAPGPQ